MVLVVRVVFVVDVVLLVFVFEDVVLELVVLDVEVLDVEVLEDVVVFVGDTVTVTVTVVVVGFAASISSPYDTASKRTRM